MRLLVVEDNALLSELLAKGLHTAGYETDLLATAAEARAALMTTTYAAVILDLGLPDGDGSEVLRALRRAGKGTPVLVATARDDVTKRVCTLNEGADDYLVKPFDLDELLARIRALLRRPPQTVEERLEAGNLVLDTAAMTLSIDGQQVDVPRRELSVLAALLRHQGRLLPRQRLEEAIYSFDQEVTPNALEVAVSRLRRRLDSHGASVTVTAMRGLGYILAERASC